MGDAVHFGSTIWSVVERARQGDPKAADLLVRTYRRPVLQYIRRKGIAEHDAEDVAQEVFLRLTRRGILERCFQTGGRFRSLLIGVTKNVLHESLRRESARKRGGDVKTRPLPTDSQVEAPGVPQEEDETFDQFWMLHLIQRAFERLQKECLVKKTSYYDATRLFILDGCDYRTISQNIGQPLTNIKNLVQRGRLKLVDFLRQEIADYSQPGSQYEDEVRRLMRYLRE
jgi:RNA polymerase sigma-70 factor (ECF subfamily)